MDLKNIHKSKIVVGIIIGLLIAIIALAIFQIGMTVGYRKAIFSRGMGESFERNFMGGFNDNRRPPGFFGEMPLPGGHGAVGEIVSINYPNFVVAGPDNLEKTVIVNDETAVRQFRDEIKSADLQVGQFIVVLGNPNDSGEVLAKLIRVVPPPPDNFEVNSNDVQK